MNRLFKYATAVMALVVSAAGTALASPEIPAVPEPGTFILLGAGVAGLLIYKKTKK